jgi:hypothetical protein
LGNGLQVGFSPLFEVDRKRAKKGDGFRDQRSLEYVLLLM